jgi:hypothetical protein
MRSRRVIRCGAGICLFGCACAEAAELRRPAQAVCEDGPEVRDLGPPAGCGDVIGSHPRYLRLVSLASTTSSVTAPVVSFTVYYADEPATAVDQQFHPTGLCTSSSMSSGDISMRIVEFIVTPGRWPPRQVRVPA